LRIRTKLFFWFALAALLPAVVIAFFAAGEADRRFRVRAREELSRAEEMVSHELNRIQQSIRSRMRRLIESDLALQFARQITAPGLVRDAYRQAETLNSQLGLELDFFDIMRDSGIVISSLQWIAYAGNADPHWQQVRAAADGDCLVGPVRVGERDLLALRVIYRLEDIAFVGGLRLSEELLLGMRTSARAMLFLADGVARSVVPERLSLGRVAQELESTIDFDALGEPPSSTASLSAGQFLIRIVSLPGSGGQSSAAVVVLYPSKELDEAFSGLLTTFLLAAAVGIGLALMLGFLVARLAATPLERLVYSFELLALGDFDIRLPERRSDEIGGLFRAFNTMAADLARLRQQLVRTERVAAWQEVARKVAHEIKNPLSPIQISIETLQKARSKRLAQFDEIFTEATATILEEVEKIRRIVGEFSDFARLPEPELHPTDLRQVVEKVLGLCEARLAGARLLTRFEPVPEVDADPEHVNRLVMNLVLNAAEALSGRGSIAVSLDAVSNRSGNWVRLAVADDGPGMDPEVLGSAFTPYFTTKPEGSGLGLVICQRIVEQHRGRLTINSEPGSGTTVEVFLPARN